MTMLGSNCGVDNIWALNKINDLCNLYGLDTISAGGTIAFAMECFERGLIDKKDTDGLDLRFGNADVEIELLGKIARREGFGNILAEGSRRAAGIIGNGAENYAIHVKGMEIAAHDPRSFPIGGGPHYAATVTGGRHTEAITVAYENFGAISAALGCPEPWKKSDTKQMVYITKLYEDWTAMLNMMGYCQFSGDGAYGAKDDELNHVKAYNAVTGLQISVHDSLVIGERVFNLRKAFNMRHGCTRSEDTLPKRLMKESNKRAGGAVVDLSETLPEFYRIRGWDPATSIPTRDKLRELGLDDIAEDLWSN
jgi:aldehyde:ferredoxin oxidoreductase